MADDQSALAPDAAGPTIPEDDRKLFVGGLPQEATEADLREHFGAFGAVASVNLKMDQFTGRSRGFAFIVFESAEPLDAVLAQEHVIKEKKVAAKKAASKQGKVYVGKFTGAITEDEIRQHFSQYGNIVEIQRPIDRSNNDEPKNFCFITFEKEQPAETLLAQERDTVNGMTVEIKRVNNKNDGGGGGMRGGRGGGRGGGGGGGGYGGGGQWGGYGGGGGGYGGGGGGWGDYGAQQWGGQAAYGNYGGYGGYGSYGGGGKMGGAGGGGMGGGGYGANNYGGAGYGAGAGGGRGGGRGGRGGRGRDAPY